MVKWTFNSLLLSKLSDVLDLSCNEIARRCHMSHPALYHYMKGDVDTPIQALVQLCNDLRMPTRYFICDNGHFVIPNRETATVEADKWKPITWNREAVELTFGDGEGKIFWKDVATIMGVTSQKPHERFLLRTRFPVNSFLLTCSHFNLSPFLFINDPNQEEPTKARPTPKPRKQKTSPPPSYAELQERVDQLELEVTDLQQKFEKLLHNQEVFLKRMQVNIQDVHNSNIGINDRMDMAAEQEPKSE